MHVLQTTSYFMGQKKYRVCSTEIWFPKTFNRLTLYLWVRNICPGEIRYKFRNKTGEITVGGKKVFCQKFLEA